MGLVQVEDRGKQEREGVMIGDMKIWPMKIWPIDKNYGILYNKLTSLDSS